MSSMNGQSAEAVVGVDVGKARHGRPDRVEVGPKVMPHNGLGQPGLVDKYLRV